MNPLSKALLSLPDPVFRLLFGKPEERDGHWKNTASCGLECFS